MLVGLCCFNYRGDSEIRSLKVQLEEQAYIHACMYETCQHSTLLDDDENLRTDLQKV